MPKRRSVFFRGVVAGGYVVLFSAETVRELGDAPQAVKDLLNQIPQDCLESVAMGPEVETLARGYVSAGVVGPSSESDALHVAAVTVARAEVIVSWNFRHIVNYERIRKYNGVNALNGYPPIDIRSPLEMSHGEEDQDF